MNGIKYSSCIIQCNKRQADKCNKKKTCTYLQVVVHDIQRQDQQSIFCSVWSQKDLHGSLCFVANFLKKKHFKGIGSPIF